MKRFWGLKERKKTTFKVKNVVKYIDIAVKKYNKKLKRELDEDDYRINKYTNRVKLDLLRQSLKNVNNKDIDFYIICRSKSDIYDNKFVSGVWYK